jgi:hypothetical protein
VVNVITIDKTRNREIGMATNAFVIIIISCIASDGSNNDAFNAKKEQRVLMALSCVETNSGAPELRSLLSIAKTHQVHFFSFTFRLRVGPK